MAGRTRLHSEIMFGDNVPDDDISFKNPKKRILFDEETSKTAEMSEHMKCYLRIRPFSEEEAQNNEDQNCISIEDEHTIAAHAPKDSHTFKNCAHGLGKTTHKFKFSRIFDSATTQKNFFNDTMLGLVKDFIDGQNCLVFTYGVTSSGKTYTIQGKPKDAGILPRALDVIFNSINGKQWPNNRLKPKMFMDVMKLSTDQAEEDLKIKERTMKMVTFEEPDVMSLLGDDASDMSQISNATTCSERSNASYDRTSKDSLDEVFSDLENRVREEAAVCVEDQGLIKFSVWVSFAEIYNEQIFDLLEPIPKKKTTRRPVLRLSDDKNGSPYIRGLKEIHVTSADEAYNLLTVGQKNLRTACTKLNHQSSRSHCIFNIKILRVVDKGNPNHARVSMLSLCDLAGSERHSKTQSKGDRLKEAGNINTSLMTLGRCIEILRNNQHHKDKTQLIPFRDSKLTRLFQNFFCGRGKAAMIVNVNQCSSMFDETLHVFKFSAVAKQVVVVQKPDPPPKKRIKSVPPPKQAVRPSIPWATPGRADVSLMNSALKRGQEVPLPEDDDDDLEDNDSMDESERAELIRIIENLHEKLKEERRSKLFLERDVREEVCKEMMDQIVKIENEYEEQLRERDMMAEEMMERKIKVLTDAWSSQKRKRPRQEVMEDEDDEWVSSILLHQEQVKVQSKEKELEEVKDELDKVQTQLNKYISEQEDYIGKNTSLQFQLAAAQKSETEAKEEVKTLKEKLNAGLVSHTKSRGSEVDFGNSCLLETLTQQLKEAKDQIKEQAEEIEELNAMLTEAGETFQQKEDKIKQLESLISELQVALEDSKHAVTTAEERLVLKDEKIVKLETEASEFQESTKTQKNCNIFLEETIKHKEEEIHGLRSKLTREEGESTKREQALINGYKAEISVLKSQIQQLRFDSRGMSPVKSPSKKHKEIESPAKRMKIDHESPRKCKLDSPVRRLKTDKESEDKKHYKEDLSRQIKDMQGELMKNSAVTAELESALQVSRMTTEDLESRLASEQKARIEVNSKLEEVEEKSKNYDQLKLDLENETVAKKKSEEQVEMLTAELNSLGDVRSLYEELQYSYDELEKDLATKVEENLMAGEKIKSLESSVDGLDNDKNKCEQILLGCLHNLSKISESSQCQDLRTDQNVDENSLEAAVHKLEMVIQSCCQEWDEKMWTLKIKEENIEKLKEELSEKNGVNESLKEKMEELETVNASLRDMVNKTTSHIQEKETEIKEIVVESLQSCDSPSSSNSLTNLKRKMKELKEESENAKAEMHKFQKELENVKISSQKMENEKKKISETCKDLEFQLEEKSIEIIDITEIKIAMETKVSELEHKVTELETMSKEKTNQLIELNDELNKMKVAREMLEEDFKDLEEEHENLQTIVEANSDLKKECEDVKQELENKEKSMAELIEKVEGLTKQVKEKAEKVTKLKGQLKKLEDGEINKQESLKHTMEMQEKEIKDLKQKLEEQIVESNKQVNMLEQELIEKSDLLQKNSDCLQNAEKEASDHKKAFEKLNLEINQAKELQLEKVNTFESEVQVLQGKNEELNEKCVAFEKSEVDLRKKLEACVEERDSCKLKVESMEKEKDLLQTNLDTTSAKCNELEKQNSYLESRSSGSEDEHSTLGEAKLKIAELKSALHMHKTLHEKAKNVVIEKDSAIAKLEEELETVKKESSSKGNHSVSDSVEIKYEQCVKAKEEIQCTCDRLKSELENKNEEVMALDEQMAKLEKANNDFKEESDSLHGKLSEYVKEISLLKEDLDKSKLDISLRTDVHAASSKKEVDKLSKVCTQQEMLIREQNLKIKKYEKNDSEKQELKAELEKVKNKFENLEQELSKCKLEVKAYQEKTAISDREIKNSNEAISQQQKMICQQAEKIKELMHCGGTEVSMEELNRIKSELKGKNEELEVVKSKLDSVESDLVRISEVLSSKEQIIENLKDNLTQVRETECLSPSSQSHCARKLRKEKIDIENQLIEARYRIKQLESEVQSGVLSSPRRLVNTESLQRASVTSPTVHRELNRSQEREQNLRSQLQMASQTVKSQNEKISQLEKELLETGTKLRVAEDSLKQRQSIFGASKGEFSSEEVTSMREESSKRWEMIQDLEKDLQKKEAKIQTKTQTINNMKANMEMEREKFEAALKDAQANEAVIEELKNAIALQEETMEGQDRYIQQKEETINKLQQEVEKFTDKYHSLLTSSGDSSREIREMARENAKASAEMEETKSKLLRAQEEKTNLSSELRKLEAQLRDKSDELLKLKGDNSQSEHLEKAITELKSSNIKNSDIISNMQRTIDELRIKNQKIADEKLVLSIVIKENNEELKEMEKLLCDKRKELEDLQSGNNTQKLESVEIKYHEQEKLLTDMKAKIKDKDQSLRESQREMKKIKEELAETSHRLDSMKSDTKEKDHVTSEQLQHKNKEIIRLQQEVEKKMNELNNWKQERDKLVQGLEGIMQKQQTEINNLKKQKSELEERLSQEVTTGRTRNKSGRENSRSQVVESKKDVVIKEEALEVFHSPPRRPPPPKRGRKRRSPTLETSNCDMPSSSKKENIDHTFVSEEGDTTQHIEIDVTPAIAAKNLRRARKKRSSVDLLRTLRSIKQQDDKENKKSTRGKKTRTGSKNTDSSLSRIMSVIKESPITRSAKKFIEDVSTPNKDGDSTIEVEDHGTQMSPAIEVSKRSRKRHQLYKDEVQISEPLDCGRFAEPSPDDVHHTVQRKLRGRRK